MTPEEVFPKVQGRQFMTPDQARMVRWLIRFFRLKRILELGHMHGSSTCQLAAAAELIGGHVTTIDVRKYDPSAESNLTRCGLKNVTIYIESEGAGGEWRLLQFLEDGQAETYDLIYIDARHLWSWCAADFIMCERLLRPGGWMLFDDILLNHQQYPNDVAWIKAMTPEEKACPQVGMVWKHLVSHHPAFENHTTHGNWGFCQKRL